MKAVVKKLEIDYGDYFFSPQGGDPSKIDTIYIGDKKFIEEKYFDVFKWLNDWVEGYEKEIGDRKAKDFQDWIHQQPMCSL